MTMSKQYYHSTARLPFPRTKTVFSKPRQAPAVITKFPSPPISPVKTFRNKKIGFKVEDPSRKDKKYSKTKDRRRSPNAPGYITFSLRLKPRFKPERLVLPKNGPAAASQRRLFFRAQSRRCKRLFQSFVSLLATEDWGVDDEEEASVVESLVGSIFVKRPSKQKKQLLFSNTVHHFLRHKPRPFINKFNRAVHALRKQLLFYGPPRQRLSVVKGFGRLNKRFWKNGSLRRMPLSQLTYVLCRLFERRFRGVLVLKTRSGFRKFLQLVYRTWENKIKAKAKILFLLGGEKRQRRLQRRYWFLTRGLRLMVRNLLKKKRRAIRTYSSRQARLRAASFRKNFALFFREAMTLWRFYELNRRRPRRRSARFRHKQRPFRFHRNRLARLLLRKENARLRPLRLSVGRFLSRPAKQRKKSPARLRYSMRRMRSLMRSHSRGVPYDFPKPGDGFAWPSRIKESKIVPLIDIATAAIANANEAAVDLWQLRSSLLLAGQKRAFLYYFKGHLWDYRLPLAVLPSSTKPPQGLFPFFDPTPVTLLYWQPLWSGLDQLGFSRNFLSHERLSVNWRPLITFLINRSVSFPWARLFFWTFFSREVFFWSRSLKRLKISLGRIEVSGQLGKRQLDKIMAQHFQDAWTYPHLYEAQLNRIAILVPFLSSKLRLLLFKNFRSLLSYHPYFITSPSPVRDNGIWRMRRWLQSQRQYFRRTRRLLITNSFFNRIKLWYRRLLHYRRLRNIAFRQKNPWRFFYHYFLKRRVSPMLRGMRPFSRAGQHFVYLRRRLNRKKLWRFRGPLTLFLQKSVTAPRSSLLTKAFRRARSMWEIRMRFVRRFGKRFLRRKALPSKIFSQFQPKLSLSNAASSSHRVRAKRRRPSPLAPGPFKLSLSAGYRWQLLLLWCCHFFAKTISAHRLHRALSWLSAARGLPISPVLNFSSFNALVFFWKALLFSRNVTAFTTPYALACFCWSSKKAASKRRRYFRRWFTGFFYRKRRRGRRFVPAYYRRFNYIRRLPFRTFRLFWPRSANFVRSRIRSRPRPLRFSRRLFPSRKLMAVPSVHYHIAPNRRNEFRQLAADVS